MRHSVATTCAVVTACLMVSGCGEAPHKICIDEMSTKGHLLKWQNDLRIAKEAGQLSVSDVVSLHSQAYGQFGLMRDNNWGAYCKYVDKIRGTRF